MSLGLALIAALGLRVWLAAGNAGLTMDSPLYVRMGEAFRGGQTVAGPAHPGYPALLAIASLVVPGREWPGRVVSLVAGLALVALSYALARRRLPPGWSATAAWLVALHPLIAIYSGAIMTEATLLALLYAGVLWIELGRPALGGVGLGVAWWVRPEALAIAVPAALLSRRGGRSVLAIAAVAAAFVLAYSAYLRVEQGHWMLSPKAVLLQPVGAHGRAAEWRLSANPAVADSLPLLERLKRSAPSIERDYLPRLVIHLDLLLQAWPWPVMALSLIGLVAPRRALLAPLLLTAGLPLLAVPFDARFALLPLPALAVLAVGGAATLIDRLPVPRAASATALVAVLLAGLAIAWEGPPGRLARGFDDGPMPQMREAGEWIRLQGGAPRKVMDRKAYVPFLAGAEHIQFPDDDYDTVLDYARREGVDYIVFEEYLIMALRPQFLPLVQDREFRLRERRVRLGFFAGPEPMTGVAVFEVVRDSLGQGTPLDAPLPGARLRR